MTETLKKRAKRFGLWTTRIPRGMGYRKRRAAARRAARKRVSKPKQRETSG